MFRRASPTFSPLGVPPGVNITILSVDLAPEGNFQQAQADMLAHMIGDVENSINAGSVIEDPEKKVVPYISLFSSFPALYSSAVCIVLHIFFIV